MPSDTSKVEFKGPQSVELRAVGDRRFVVTRPYTVDVRMGARQFYFTVPVGFETDLGSVPRVARGLVSVASAPAPFVLHDFLCRTGPDGITRRDADRIMLAAMHALGQPRAAWSRYVAYLGVRIGAMFLPSRPPKTAI